MADPAVRRFSKVPSFVGNWLGLLGVILAASAGFAAVSLIAIDFFHGFTNPYLGILTYLVAPGFLILGLLLTAAGAIRERRRRRRMGPGEVPAYPRIDLNDARVRRTFIVTSGAALVFLLFSALGSYRTYQFTESVEFCGKTCHSVMKPEYTAYQGSPHARVACAECHIGAGATWYVKSKLSGAYQVYASLANKYPRPIPAPIQNLRPAQETCEQCHWPQKFFGAAQKVFQHAVADEGSSPWTIQMLLKIGGGDPRTGPVGGIHWHMNIANRIEYVATDRQRQVIPWVRLTDLRGQVTVFQSTDHPLEPAQLAAAQPRRMDCVDCHNRPTHIYNSPARALDEALSNGRIDRQLPFVKKQAIAALTAKYATEGEALKAIATSLTGFYQAQYPAMAQASAKSVEQLVAEVQDIYRHNFFPEMKADWRAYPDNIGHFIFSGCFRCHDGSHTSADGRAITHDCNACHTIIAQGAGTKLETSLAGLQFKHPTDVGDAWQAASCSDCHDGTAAQ